MATFECVECKLYYCVDCEPGEDLCDVCHTGPRCNDCAVEHAETHQAEADEANEAAEETADRT